MISKLQRRLAGYLRGAARRLDVPAAKTGKSQGVGHAETAPFFNCLEQLGLRPQHIVDVGANRGNWTRTAKRYFPDAQYTLFEPQGELMRGSELESDPKVSIFSMGVGPSTSTMKLSKHERDDSFSFALSEEEAQAQGREQVEAPVVALDEFLAEKGLPYPNILKVDAEGWDLEVLKGAEKSVAHADVVLLEAAVMCYRFSNKIERVLSEMQKRGFMLFDITDLNRPLQPRVLWLVEVAFVKEGGSLFEAFKNATRSQ